MPFNNDMRIFRDLSIRTKIVLLAIASASVALLLSCIGFAVNDIQMMRDSTVKSLSTQARMLAFNSTAVLSFRDAPAAEQLLKSLKSQPWIEFACLYDSGGKVLATYSKDGVSESIPPSPGDNGYQFTDHGTLEMFQKVQDGDEFVGTLYLCENVMFLRQQLYEYVKIASIMMLCSLLGLRTAGNELAEGRIETDSGSCANRRADHYGVAIIQYAYSNNLATNWALSTKRSIKCWSRVETSEKQLLAAQNVLEEKVLERTAQLRCEIAEKERAQAELERAKDAAENATRIEKRVFGQHEP